MCELISGVVELKTGRVLFNVINSHSGIEEKHGLKPETYREFEWTGEDRGSIRIRCNTNAEHAAVENALKWPRRSKMVAAFRDEWLKTKGNALQLGIIEGPQDDTRKMAISDGDISYRVRVDKCTSVVIPDSVTNIGDCAFDGCTGLTSVVIPDSVTNIGDYAFRGCSGLTSVVIPDSVTNIGDYAFDGCTKIIRK
jgi:hypothetical protein